MSNDGSNKLALALLLLIVLWAFVVPVTHELSHFFMAKGLGYEAELSCEAYELTSGAYETGWLPAGVLVHGLALAPTSHVVLICLAGGIGTSIFLYLLYRVLYRPWLLWIFVLLIAMQLSYAVLETSYHLGWITQPTTYLALFIGGFAGMTALGLQQNGEGRI